MWWQKALDKIHNSVESSAAKLSCKAKQPLSHRKKSSSWIMVTFLNTKILGDPTKKNNNNNTLSLKQWSIWYPSVLSSHQLHQPTRMARIFQATLREGWSPCTIAGVLQTIPRDGHANVWTTAHLQQKSSNQNNPTRPTLQSPKLHYAIQISSSNVKGMVFFLGWIPSSNKKITVGFPKKTLLQPCCLLKFHGNPCETRQVLEFCPTYLSFQWCKAHLGGTEFLKFWWMGQQPKPWLFSLYRGWTNYPVIDDILMFCGGSKQAISWL